MLGLHGEPEPTSDRPLPNLAQKIVRTPLPTEPVVVLTGTIDPRGMRLTARNDPNIRKNDYLTSFKRWLTETDFQKIVFCENSGYPLDEFESLAGNSNKTIELLSFDMPPYPDHLGKGYGELGIIEHVLNESQLIEPHSRILKSTGRIYSRRLKQFAAHGRTADFDVSGDLYRSLDEVDVRLFLSSVYFLRNYLLPLRDRLSEDTEPQQLLEKVMAQAIGKAVGDLLIFKPLPCAPWYEGYSGSLGHKYRPWLATLGRQFRVIPSRKS